MSNEQDAITKAVAAFKATLTKSRLSAIAEPNREASK